MAMQQITNMELYQKYQFKMLDKFDEYFYSSYRLTHRNLKIIELVRKAYNDEPYCHVRKFVNELDQIQRDWVKAISGN